MIFSDIQMSLRGSPMWSSMVSTVEAEVMKLLENKNKINETKNHIQPPETTELINKLIFEYMNWMGYKLTSTMFTKGKIFDLTFNHTCGVNNNPRLVYYCNTGIIVKDITQ